MGYRSQVVIGFKKTAFFKNVGDSAESFKDCDLISESEDNVIFIWEDVKWYDSYKDVQEITAVIRKCADDEYGFVRIGEEDGDIEKLGEPWEFEIVTATTVQYYDGGDEVTSEEFFKPNSIKFIKET